MTTDKSYRFPNNDGRFCAGVGPLNGGLIVNMEFSFNFSIESCHLQNWGFLISASTEYSSA